MDQDLLITLLSRLNKHAFESFILEKFHSAEEPLLPLEEAGSGVLYARWLKHSYAGNVHTVFIMHYLPVELFRNPSELDVAEPDLLRRLDRVKTAYEGKVGYFGFADPELREVPSLYELAFLVNCGGLSRSFYDEYIFPKYQALIEKWDVGRMLLGSYDSFLDLQAKETQEAFRRFVAKYRDGLTIGLVEDEPRITTFGAEAAFTSGVLRQTEVPCEPLLALPAAVSREVVAEFQELVEKNAREATLERFLQAHYQEVFGFKYDRIELQLWLRFPELDVGGKDRRLDVLLRNSIERDWELVELKRPAVQLTGTYRDIPMLSREVSGAIQQLRNYGRILDQDSVKRHFAAEGIEYYSPELRLVIGRGPQIPHETWRWLKSTGETGLKIMTFDDLLAEMKLRLGQRLQLQSEG